MGGAFVLPACVEWRRRGRTRVTLAGETGGTCESSDDGRVCVASETSEAGEALRISEAGEAGDIRNVLGVNEVGGTDKLAVARAAVVATLGTTEGVATRPAPTTTSPPQLTSS